MDDTPPLDATLNQVLTAHARIRSDLRSQVEAISMREQELKALLEDCLVRRAKIQEQERALDTTEALYRKMLGTNADGGVGQLAISVAIGAKDAEPQKPPRARIGPQRYQMFIALRTFENLSRHEIAEVTNLSEKRVRDQMVSDLQSGFVYERGAEEKLSLTPAGLSLLERFEAYQKLRGKKLAQLGDATDDADEQAETDNDDASGQTSLPSSLLDASWKE
ncbi:hypothetical protein [Azospirillum sp. TSO5]|uniref:hypothetical protein n=1 Tax=Azospirillum sp. TSO5 TaxID=716760 RepID=UPI000D616AC1|nr:hypothetical protein [Azospirillum sp. TSO5]PWC93234.1 hypothetical protein TSO5_15360 [Azospirillum sp. TSO5]